MLSDLLLSRRSVLWGAAAAAVPGRAAETLLVDDFQQGGSRDHTAAFNAAYQAARGRRLHLRCRPGARYAVSGPIDIRPEPDGWTPDLNLERATIVLQSESAGFRRRGIRDGETANVASGRIHNGTIDANRITGGNGVRCIFGSNSGGTWDDVAIINMAGGYGWLRHCYVDGGRPVGAPVFSGSVSGQRDGGAPLKWYGCGDSADLTVGRPGDVVPPGGLVALASPAPGANDSTGCAPLGQTVFWRNASARPVTVPADPRDGARQRAGLRKGEAVRQVNGVAMGAAQAEYFASGGRRIAGAAVVAPGAQFRDLTVTGGYYSIIALGQEDVRIENVRCLGSVRGVVAEFGARRLTAQGVSVSGMASSAVLLGYGASSGRLADISIVADARWTGEALLNITLGSGDTVVENVRTQTPANVPHGQYHVYVGPGCSRTRLSRLRLAGDCLKAYVAVESAWSTTPMPAEAFSGDPSYAGLASTDLTDIDISDVSISVPAATTSAATALALTQNQDAIHGEIGLSRITIRGFRAPSPKHVRSLRILEHAGAPAKQARDISVLDSDLPVPARVTPRGRAHFAAGG